MSGMKRPADLKDEKPRKHYRFVSKEIVNECLSNSIYQNAIKWLVPGRSFQVNWTQFDKFYCSRYESIKKEHYFEKDEKGVPENGYDDVYDWVKPDTTSQTSQTSTVSTSHISTPPQPPATLTPQSNPMSHSQSSLLSGDENESSSLEDIIEDSDAFLTLERMKKDSNTKDYSINLFLEIMSSNKRFKMTQEDMNNIHILLKAESNGRDNITPEELNYFLKRFGPLAESIRRIREFIKDGAPDWYHGNISREVAEQRLQDVTPCSPNQTVFLIRSVTPQLGKELPDTTYIFTFSYMQMKDETKVVKHIRIYINGCHQLVFPAYKNSITDSAPTIFPMASGPSVVPFYLPSLKTILHLFFPNALCLGAQEFQGLKGGTEEVICGGGSEKKTENASPNYVQVGQI